MSQLTVSIDFKGNKLKLTQGTLEYLAKIDPAVEWSRRGYKATRYEKSEQADEQKKIAELVKERLDIPDDEAIDDFVAETLEVYESLLNRNFEPIREMFEGLDFYFITGPPRTGGTFLLKALLELRGEKLKNYNHKLVFDYVPLNTQLGEEYGPQKTRQVIFGWAQWMVWTKRRFDTSTHKFIPKKHIGMLFQMDLFESILGDAVNFIITTRHPGEAYQSYVERFVSGSTNMMPPTEVGLWKHSVIPRTNIDEEQWDNFSFPDQFLLYWCACYLEVLNYGDKENLTVLTFGKDYEKFLKEFAWDHNLMYSPEKFDPTEREDLPEFSDPCLEMKEKVENLWKKKFGKPLY